MLNKALPRPPTAQTAGRHHRNIPLHTHFPNRLHHTRLCAVRDQNRVGQGVSSTHCDENSIQERKTKTQLQGSARVRAFVIVQPVVEGMSGGAAVVYHAGKQLVRVEGASGNAGSRANSNFGTARHKSAEQSVELRDQSSYCPTPNEQSP
jgi:hypothetical protein